VTVDFCREARILAVVLADVGGGDNDEVREKADELLIRGRCQVDDGDGRDDDVRYRIEK
jgi:hypothetical protein